MTYYPLAATVIQERIDIGQQLDDSAELSLLQRARFRLELIAITDNYDRHLTGCDLTLTALASLHDRVAAVIKLH